MWKPFRKFLDCTWLTIINLWNMRSKHCNLNIKIKTLKAKTKPDKTFLLGKIVLGWHLWPIALGCIDSAGVYALQSVTIETRGMLSVVKHIFLLLKNKGFGIFAVAKFLSPILILKFHKRTNYQTRANQESSVRRTCRKIIIYMYSRQNSINLPHFLSSRSDTLHHSHFVYITKNTQDIEK